MDERTTPKAWLTPLLRVSGRVHPWGQACGIWSNACLLEVPGFGECPDLSLAEPQDFLNPNVSHTLSPDPSHTLSMTLVTGSALILVTC